MSADEERIALFLDYENLAIGARENLGGMVFDLRPVADALAERGRVVVRRAYADWLKFGEDGRMLTRHHVELIEIPQRMGSVRKNAADIKMAVDCIELCLERDYITTFVLGTGDSDFTPLVHKLREHNKQVIGVGIQMSTSALLPPACDEFLFYERLEGVELPKRRAIVPRNRGRGRRPQVGDVGELGPVLEAEQADQPVAARSSRNGPARGAPTGGNVAQAGDVTEPEAVDEVDTPVGDEPTGPATLTDVEKLLTQTLAGLERASGSVRASSLKRAVLRKSSTFSEADYGFRSFTELLRSLAERGVLEITDSASVGDPDVQLPTGESLGEEAAAFDLLASVVDRLGRGGSGTPLSGLKTQLRRTDPEFSEKRFGFGGFLQFAKAATTRGVVNMAWNDEADDYLLTPVDGRPGVATNDGVGNGAAPMLQAVPDLTPLPGPTQQHDAASDEATGSPRPQRRRGRRGRGSNIGDGAEPTPDHLSWAIPAQPAPPLDEPAGSRWPNTGSATAWADTDTDTDTDNDTAGDAGWTDADDDSDQQEDPGWTATPAAPEPAVTATATSRGFEPDQPQAAAATITDTDTDRDTDTDEPDPEPRSVRTRARRATPAAAPDATEDETQEQLVLTEAEPAPARAPKRAASPRSRSRATAGSTAAATDAQTGDPVSADPNGDAPEPKPRRRTTRKAAAPADAEGTGTAAATSESGTEGAEEAAPRRRRTRTASPKTTSGDAT